tara:strand:+ start:145 stop:1014 length:870 start_codon:yes stop_codon:yes gene_type:complete
MRKFSTLVGLSALFVAGSAAYYSVFGLSKLFSGAMFAVVVMAGSLEFAKLVSASFLYRYWNKINSWLKYYMTVGVVILVLITSAGIFGFLSNAYQGATIQFEKQSATLFYQEDRLEQLEEDKAYLKDELEQTISLLPDNYPTAKRKVREEYNPKVFALNDQILEIKQEIGDLKVALVETGVDVGPAIYLARIFDTDIDTVVKFFIFILIFVFDPMAVALVISYNVITHTDKVVVRTKKIKKNKKKNGIRKSKEIVINDNKTDIIDNDNTDIYEEGNISRMEKGGVTPSG